MPQANVVMNVRKINNTVSIIDIEGEVSAFAGPSAFMRLRLMF